jgi:hypothetical protein
MLEQQVRLSDKEAMVCVKITNFRPYRGGIKAPLRCCGEKRKKGKESLFYA